MNKPTYGANRITMDILTTYPTSWGPILQVMFYFSPSRHRNWLPWQTPCRRSWPWNCYVCLTCHRRPGWWEDAALCMDFLRKAKQAKLNLKLFGIRYLVGKIKFKLFFQGPGRLSEDYLPTWKVKHGYIQRGNGLVNITVTWSIWETNPNFSLPPPSNPLKVGTSQLFTALNITYIWEMFFSGFCRLGCSAVRMKM